MSVEYWAVPKKHFPGGLPDRMKKAQILDEELFEMEAASGASMTIDKSQYYILDKQIERAGLGKSVTSIKFYNGSSVKCCISPNTEQQAMPAAARGSMDDSESQLEAASSSASQLAAARSSASQLEAAPSSASQLAVARSSASQLEAAPGGQPAAASKLRAQLNSIGHAIGGHREHQELGDQASPTGLATCR